jgi:hypothetical protein
MLVYSWIALALATTVVSSPVSLNTTGATQFHETESEKRMPSEQPNALNLNHTRFAQPVNGSIHREWFRRSHTNLTAASGARLDEVNVERGQSGNVCCSGTTTSVSKSLCSSGCAILLPGSNLKPFCKDAVPCNRMLDTIAAKSVNFHLNSNGTAHENRSARKNGTAV